MMDSTFHSPLSTPIRSAAPPGHYYHAEFRVMAIIYCLGSSSSGPLLSHLCSICLMKLVASGRSSHSLCLPILSPPPLYYRLPYSTFHRQFAVCLIGPSSACTCPNSIGFPNRVCVQPER